MAKLLIYKNNELVEEMNLESSIEYIAGRQTGSDIQLEGLPGISRQHFRLHFSGSSWAVECLSTVKIIEIEGIEKDNFVLDANATFYLNPYRFVFQSDDIQTEDGALDADASDLMDGTESEPFEDHSDPMDEHLMAPGGDSTPQNPVPSGPPDDEFSESDERTSIKSFQGTPYLKVMGSGERKTEYYRLEGHLWVAGSDDNAALYLPDPKVAAAQFEISKVDKIFHIIDLGSSTGTLVNGQHISTSKKTELSSGDLINVGTLTLQFELRDQSFKERVKGIPLHLYENPLVFFGHEAGVLNTAPEMPQEGKAEEVLGFEKFTEEPKSKKNLAIYATVILVLLAAMMSLDNQQENKSQKAVQNLDPFQKLKPQEQTIVKNTYNLAKKLYLNAQFELALRQLDNLHDILSVGYLDSKQIEEYCMSARDLQQQKADLERQRREQHRLRQKVKSVIFRCQKTFGSSMDVDAARVCLSDAIQLDPNNPGINELLSGITARIEADKIQKKIAKEKEDLARRGRVLYLKAKALEDSKNLLEAMNAYESHINSGLPDPSGLVGKSKRNLSSIQKFIDRQKDALVSSAKSELSSANLKSAIQLTRKAVEVDPYDYEIIKFKRDLENELSNKMKNIYIDSVIEEQFGNIEASKEMWNKIINNDIEDGEYYKRSRRKLKFYGN